MNRIRVRIFPVLLVFALSGPAWGSAVQVEARAGYFFPSSSGFRDVYRGGLAFGLDLSVPVWRSLWPWTGVGIFNRTGKLTFTQEPTTLRVMPLFAGVKLQSVSAAVRPYLAVAAGEFFYKETNVIGTASGRKFGLVAQLGLLVRVKGRVFLDIHGRYTTCKPTFDGAEPVTSQLGGIQGGLGLSVRI